jgi:hypothetical protein
MSNEQVIGFDAARYAMKSGYYGLAGLWIVGFLLLIPGIVFGSWIFLTIAVLVLVPTGIAQYRRHQNRKMWESPPE